MNELIAEVRAELPGESSATPHLEEALDEALTIDDEGTALWKVLDLFIFREVWGGVEQVLGVKVSNGTGDEAAGREGAPRRCDSCSAVHSGKGAPALAALFLAPIDCEAGNWNRDVRATIRHGQPSHRGLPSPPSLQGSIVETPPTQRGVGRLIPSLPHRIALLRIREARARSPFAVPR